MKTEKRNSAVWERPGREGPAGGARKKSPLPWERGLGKKEAEGIPVRAYYPRALVSGSAMTEQKMGLTMSSTSSPKGG